MVFFLYKRGNGPLKVTKAKQIAWIEFDNTGCDKK